MIDGSEFNYGNDTKYNIDCLKRNLRDNFESKTYKNSLLVLIGVQNEKTLRAFELNCKIMLTTRHRNIFDFIPDHSKTEIKIHKGFNRNEAEELLIKILKRKLTLKEIENINTVNGLCNGHPFIMNLIVSNLVLPNNSKKEKLIDESGWDSWIKSLKNKETNDDIDLICKKTLSTLENEQIERFNSLCIFKSEEKIPINVIINYWGSNFYNTRKMLGIFENVALLKLTTDENSSIVMEINCAISSYLLSKVSPQEKIAMHKTLVDSYK